MQKIPLLSIAARIPIFVMAVAGSSLVSAAHAEEPGLWEVYNETF